jgi:hypothetical protein
MLAVAAIASMASVTFNMPNRRAAQVPHQQPIAHSGAKIQSTEISVGTPVIASSSQPRLADGENAGIVIPRFLGQARLRLPIWSSTSIGFHFERGLDKGATALSANQPAPGGGITGFAASLFRTENVSPKFDIGFGGQLWYYYLPVAEYDTCVGCSDFIFVKRHRNGIAVLSLGVLPTYEVTPGVSLFAGLTLRNHPTVEKSDIPVGPVNVDEEVEAGRFDAVGSFGADAVLTEHVKLTFYWHRPFTAKPVVYGTSAGLMLTFIPWPKASP